MNFGEDIYHDGAGVVCGKNTDRVVATFSHEQEAKAFCELYNERTQGKAYNTTNKRSAVNAKMQNMQR